MTKFVFLLFLGFFGVACNQKQPARKDVFAVEIPMAYGGIQRLLTNKNKWPAWWPGTVVDSSHLLFNGYLYQFDAITWDGLMATIIKGKDSTKTYLQVLSGKNNHSIIQASSDPVTPSLTYKAALLKEGKQAIVENLAALLMHLRAFFSHSENIYGMPIEMQQVKDSSYISFSSTFDHYPETEQVYEMVAAIKTHISKHKGQITDQPIMNVHQTDPAHFVVMVALATQKDVAPDSRFQLKKMVLGTILKGTIRGGTSRIQQAEQQLQNYVRDFNKSSPAIPFQKLVTNRMTQPDTSKWITDVYYPVFN